MKYFPLHILAELSFIGGLVLQFYVLLSPIPWSSNDPNTSLLKFTPYVEPQGYVAPNPCGSSPLSNSTIHSVNETSVDVGSIPPNGPYLRFRRLPAAEQTDVVPITKREGDGSQGDVPQIAVWIGPLGTCSRDADGSVFCTKPSYNHPQYNLTWVQGNSVFFPDMIPEVIKRHTILALLTLNVIGFVFFVFGSLSFWFPYTWQSMFPTTATYSKDGGSAPPILVLLFLVLSLITQFFANFSIHVTRIGMYNSIDNFYLPAACGEPRQLRPGVLLRASNGHLYNLFWAGWCLVFLYPLLILACRLAIVSDGKVDLDAVRADKELKKQEKAKKKEEAEFRKQVEKEKIAMAARAELEMEKGKGWRGSASSPTSDMESGALSEVPPYSPDPPTLPPINTERSTTSR